MSKIKVGDIVRWYDYYAEGNIIRDGGEGFITKIGTKGAATGSFYNVYRIRKQDEQVFHESCIELISIRRKNG
tara:strand:- start:5788 stop:6006 length:219 start_codon:yes stop_codon:yes gene_type:complete